MKKQKIDLDNEALSLLDFHGGDVPNSIEKSYPYFLNREIPNEHWNRIHQLAMQYLNHP